MQVSKWQAGTNWLWEGKRNQKETMKGKQKEEKGEEAKKLMKSFSCLSS